MARRGWWALVPFVLGVLSGCHWTDHSEPSAWISRLGKQAVAPDQTVLRVAMIEVPIGHEFINEKLWHNIDEMAVDDERRDVLKANGLRVGQLIGSPGTELQKLLLSKQSCPEANDFTCSAEKKTPIPLGPAQARSSFIVVNGSSLTEVSLEDARYCLEVVALPAREGTKLTLTPRVEHGAPRLPFQSSPDFRAWELRTEKASNRYPELSWDVTLGTGQYLLVGTYPGKERTLGQNAFIQSDTGVPKQRLLVIINCRPGELDESDADSHFDSATPLAVQAATMSPRAKSR